MAEEKPNTCITAQVWVADQRSRWNDLGSLHLADIDLLLDKQLQWITGHSDVDSLLKLLPSYNSSVSSPSHNHKPIPNQTAPTHVPKVESEPNLEKGFAPIYNAVPEEPKDDIDNSNDQVQEENGTFQATSASEVQNDDHNEDEMCDGAPQLYYTKDMDRNGDMQPALEPDSVLRIEHYTPNDTQVNVDTTQDISIHSNTNLEAAFVIDQDDDKATDTIPLPLPIVIADTPESNTAHHPIEIIDNGYDEPNNVHSHKHNLIVESDQHMSFMDSVNEDGVNPADMNARHEPDKTHSHKADLTVEFNQHMSDVDNVIEDSVNAADTNAHHESDNTHSHKADLTVESNQHMSDVDNVIEDSVNAADTNAHHESVNAHSQKADLAVESNQHMSDVDNVIEDSVNAADTNAHHESDNTHSHKADLTFESNQHMSDMDNVNAVDVNIADTNGHQKPDHVHPHKADFAVESYQHMSYVDNLNADDVNSPDTNERKHDSSIILEMIPSPNLHSSINDKNENTKHQESEPKLPSNLSEMQISPGVSAAELPENSKQTSVPQENIPPNNIPQVTRTPVSVASSCSPYDDDDDIDEVILVGDKSSTKWSRPVARRISRMPPVERHKPVRRTLQAPDKSKLLPTVRSKPAAEKNDKEIASIKAATQKTKTLSLIRTKSPIPIPEKVVMPLDEHDDSNILWVSNDDSSKSKTGGNKGRNEVPGSKFVSKLLDAYHDKSPKQRNSDDGSSPLEKLERKLDEVLEDIDRNSLEINNSLCALDENRNYLHAKRDMGRVRQRNYMSPTASRLKRLEAQRTSHKLQSKLLSAQAIPQTKTSAMDKYSTMNTHAKSSSTAPYASSKQAKPEVANLQSTRKKRLGILNGMNAERLKLVQQRRMLQERELQGNKGSGNHSTKLDMNHQDSVKLPSSQSFAKSTLSTQMKSTHKPVETIAKPLSQTSYPSIKSWTSNPSKGQDASFVRSKPLETPSQPPAVRSDQAPSQEHKNVNQAPPAKKDILSIPNSVTHDQNSQDEDSRPRKRPKLPMPGWAMSPELKKALEDQCGLNPEDIFGKMAPLRIEEIFKSSK